MCACVGGAPDMVAQYFRFFSSSRRRSLLCCAGRLCQRHHLLWVLLLGTRGVFTSEDVSNGVTPTVKLASPVSDRTVLADRGCGRTRKPSLLAEYFEVQSTYPPTQHGKVALAFASPTMCLATTSPRGPRLIAFFLHPAASGIGKVGDDSGAIGPHHASVLCAVLPALSTPPHSQLHEDLGDFRPSQATIKNARTL